MRVALVTGPAIEPITLWELEQHLRIDPDTDVETDLLNGLITAARLDVENDTSRKIITQTWDYFPQTWPDNDRLKIPFGNLQTASLAIKYKNSAGAETTLTLTTDYLIQTNGDQCGFIVLPYGGSWPSATLYPSNPITITFTCGYGATAASVPETIKQAIKCRCVASYTNRGDNIIGQTVIEDKTYSRLINNIPRLYDLEFL